MQSHFCKQIPRFQIEAEASLSLPDSLSERDLAKM